MTQRIGFAMCGSFCTFHTVIKQMQTLRDTGFQIQPIMSEAAYLTDTRFGKATEHRKKIEEICENKILHTLPEVEPIGPKKMLDVLIVAPCTGNTIGKLANGITDSVVTLAVKAHLRNDRPVLLGVSTNDALGASAANIGKLMNSKNIYFIPMRQDDCHNKPKSVVAAFDHTLDALLSVINGKQIQPIFI